MESRKMALIFWFKKKKKDTQVFPTFQDQVSPQTDCSIINGLSMHAHTQNGGKKEEKSQQIP